MVFVFTKRLEVNHFSVFQQKALMSRMLRFYGDLLPYLSGFLALLLLHSVNVSNKIAGPLYRIRMVLRAVRRGDLTARARLREKDYLHQDADGVNDLIEALNEQIG